MNKVKLTLAVAFNCSVSVEVRTQMRWSRINGKSATLCVSGMSAENDEVSIIVEMVSFVIVQGGDGGGTGEH